MNGARVRLTLVFPPALEPAIIEALAADPRLPGFTVFTAEGHGRDFAGASPVEIVRGRMDQRVLWIVAAAEEVSTILDSLKGRVRSREVIWWLESLLDFGRLV